MLAQTVVSKDQKELVDIIQASCKHLYRVSYIYHYIVS